MALDVELQDGKDYLLATVTGGYDLNEAVERFSDVILACRRWGQNRVLIDYRSLDGKIGAIEEIIYATGVGEVYRTHLEAGGVPLRMAFLGNPSFIRSWVPSEDVAKSYDLEAHATLDLDEALEWLAR